MDIAIAMMTAVLGLILVNAEDKVGNLDAHVHIAQAAQVVASATLVLRRRFPVLVLIACLALSFITLVPAVIVALHATGRYLRNVAVSIACAVGTVLVVTAVLLSAPYAHPIPEFLIYLTFAMAPWIIGQGERSAAALRTQRGAEARAAVRRLTEEVREAERVRLAREMHDVVAHRISLIVLQANLLDTVAEDPAIQLRAEQIRDTGRAALEEMREILGLLRRGDIATPVEDSPELERHSLTDIEALADDARGVGQPVDLDLELTPREVPDQAERTAFRIIRESLTNAVRHAHGAPTTIRVTGDEHRIHVTVVNDPPLASPIGLTTGGNGLRGLRERIGLVGGNIAAGPTPTGGFQVEAEIPRGAS